ncbi:MAG: ABC transporter substrate-binding protein, partial [Actinobacteria bacterium]|nr:ABC transporter substrate-binding protein [Actinomycetota bacterium]
MSRKALVITAGLAVMTLALTGCGRSAGEATGDKVDVSKIDYVDITPAGTKEHGPITWGVYRDVQTLDPIFSFDYPDHTAIALMCETLVRQNPDSTLTDGLATPSRPDDLTLVLDINPKATFWDGKPVTAEDVVYSLERQRDPKLGGMYVSVFDRVKDITATGDKQVTVTFTQPDYWFDGEISARPGVIIEKAFAEKAGKDYGTPQGGIMCSGAYQLDSWVPSTGVVAKANPHYWNGETPKVSQITLKGIADDASMTSALTTGEVAGTYPQAISTLTELQKSKTVDVFQGRGQVTDLLVVAHKTGPLGDVRVRQALSLALDRQSIVDTVFKGAASIPRWLSNEGTFGYATETFRKAFEATPEYTQDIEKAKSLIKEAGVEGQTITIGMSSAIAVTASDSAAYQAAGEAIGLKVELKSVSPDNFINFFIDPKAREGVDAFPTMNLGEYPDPASLMQSIVGPGASQNYSEFSDDKLNALLEEARQTADETKRAELVVDALIGPQVVI